MTPTATMTEREIYRVPTAASDLSATFQGERIPPEIGVPYAVATSDWYEPVVTQLRHVIELEPNWDLYGASAVHVGAAETALAYVAAVMPLVGDVEPPTVTPLARGGLQLGWILDGVELDVAIGQEDAGAYWAVDDWANSWAAGVGIAPEWEGTLEQSITPVQQILFLRATHPAPLMPEAHG